MLSRSKNVVFNTVAMVIIASLWIYTEIVEEIARDEWKADVEAAYTKLLNYHEAEVVKASDLESRIEELEQ